MKEEILRALWFSSPNIPLLEMAANAGISQILLDLEHGIFDLSRVDSFILTANALGIKVHAKTLAPEMAPIQQMLDMGAHSVVIPHVGDLAHAKEVCSYAKYPPLGKRSSSGGRVRDYASGCENFYETQNELTKCYPMIETSEAFNDIEEIIALDCVDGVFIGPTDLALSQGRKSYALNDHDIENIQKIAQTANAANKPWIMPAWSDAEQALSKSLDVSMMVTAHEHGVLMAGMKQFF
ncbi:MAG: HpcH/HpaI aldolase family protein [Alphaproteobacteria bacterium]